MIIVGSDHTGIELKKEIIDYLKKMHFEYLDVTDYNNQIGDDYPDIAYNICQKVLENKSNFGIAICGTGIGISIACNKIKGIRAANCMNNEMAELSRKHNDANILCLGARLEFTKDISNVKNIVNVFLNSFYEKGRHERRILKIEQIENGTYKGDMKYGSCI